MVSYFIKTPEALSASEINVILEQWDIDAWRNLTVSEFKQKFEKSEFHVLTDHQEKLLCLTRINFDFSVKAGDRIYNIAELVGFVAVEKEKGYGTLLIRHIVHNLKNRQIECIGFCQRNLRPFYEKGNIPIFYDVVRYLREKHLNEWVIPDDDDDVLNFTLSPDSIRMFEGLHPGNPAHLLF